MKIIQDHFKIYYFIYFGLSFYQLEVIELFNWKIHPNTIHSLFSRIQRKMIKMLKFKGKQRKREGLLFPSDQRFAYLHYPFPGTISITTSHSDSRALTQTRIATRGVPLENVSTLEQRNVYRCAFSFSPGLFTSGILFFSFSFFFLLHLSSFLAWWSSINALVRETVAGSKAYPPLSNTPNHPSDM